MKWLLCYFTGICFYMWLIVYSYYRQLKNELSLSNVRLETSTLENAPILGVQIEGQTPFLTD
jgi:hypothetical protein